MEQIDIEPNNNMPRRTHKSTKTRTIVTIVLGTIGVIVGIIIVISSIISASGDSNKGPKEKYLTYENYVKIQIGMTYEQVVEILGGVQGKLDDEFGTEDDFFNSKSYSWKSEDSFVIIMVNFSDGKVTSKSQIGL